MRRYLTVVLFALLATLVAACAQPESTRTPTPTLTPSSKSPSVFLSARGGATAEWSNAVVMKPNFEPNSARLDIPPGGPPEVPYAYVAIDSPVATVNDIDSVSVQYYLHPDSTLDFAPYFVIDLDTDGDGSGCDDFLIGGGDNGPKNQWNTLNATRWRVVSQGFVYHTLAEVKDLVGSTPILRIKVAVGHWGTLEGLVVYVDNLVVNGTTYNLEPAR